MPRRQQTTPSNDENSTPPTISSPNALNHGRLEVWFEGHEDSIQTLLIEINRKQIILRKVIHMSWLKVENFGTFEKHLKAQKLKIFLELSGKMYLDLVKVFYANLKFSNGILKTSVKGVEMEITRQTWKDVAGLRQKGMQVRKGETSVVDEFNKVQYFNQCVRNHGEQTRNFHVGRLRVEERVLAMVVTKIIMLRGSN